MFNQLSRVVHLSHPSHPEICPNDPSHPTHHLNPNPSAIYSSLRAQSLGVGILLFCLMLTLNDKFGKNSRLDFSLRAYYEGVLSNVSSKIPAHGHLPSLSVDDQMRVQFIRGAAQVGAKSSRKGILDKRNVTADNGVSNEEWTA